MAIGTLTVTVSQIQRWNAQNSPSGSIAPITNGSQNSLQQDYGTGSANNTLGGADEYFNFLLTLTASSSSTVDLTAMTNVLAQATVSIARIKAFQFQLLSVAQDSVNGTACSSISIGNAATNQQLLNLNATSSLYTVYTGGSWSYSDQTAGGFVVDGSHLNLKFLNNDAGVAAKIRIQIVGGTT